MTRLPYVLTSALVGLVFLAPSPLRATTTSASDRQDQQGLMWPVQGKVTSGFGPRGFFHVHRGVDIKAPKGTPVHAAAAGMVAFSGRQSSYGRVIKIDHPNGLRTIYAHNSRNFVEVGERVKAGEVIGAVGQTGRATTNHLHFEVRRHDVARDPLPLLYAGPGGELGGSRLQTAAAADGDSGSRDGVERHGHLRAPKSHHGPSAQLHSRRGSTASASCHARTCRAAHVSHKAQPIVHRDS
jgi:Peptidase family M23